MWRAFQTGAFWVTEDTLDPWPGVAWRDLMMVPTVHGPTLPEVCRRLRGWLDDPALRDRIRRAGHAKAEQLTMRHYFDRIAEIVAERG